MEVARCFKTNIVVEWGLTVAAEPEHRDHREGNGGEGVHGAD